MRKTALYVVLGSVLAIGAVVALMRTAVHEVSVTNTGNVDVRVEYAWTANGSRVTRDKQVAPGNSISFGYQSNSEIVVYHPAPDDKAAWIKIPVEESDRKFEVSPKSGGVLTATHEGQPVSASLIPVPPAKR